MIALVVVLLVLVVVLIFGMNRALQEIMRLKGELHLLYQMMKIMEKKDV